MPAHGASDADRRQGERRRRCPRGHPDRPDRRAGRARRPPSPARFTLRFDDPEFQLVDGDDVRHRQRGRRSASTPSYGRHRRWSRVARHRADRATPPRARRRAATTRPPARPRHEGADVPQPELPGRHPTIAREDRLSGRDRLRAARGEASRTSSRPPPTSRSSTEIARGRARVVRGRHQTLRFVRGAAGGRRRRPLEFGEDLRRFRARYSGAEHADKVDGPGLGRREPAGDRRPPSRSRNHAADPHGRHDRDVAARTAQPGQLRTSGAVVESLDEATAAGQGAGRSCRGGRVHRPGRGIGRPELAAGELGRRRRRRHDDERHVLRHRGRARGAGRRRCSTRFTVGGSENTDVRRPARAGAAPRSRACGERAHRRHRHQQQRPRQAWAGSR